MQLKNGRHPGKVGYSVVRFFDECPGNLNDFTELWWFPLAPL